MPVVAQGCKPKPQASGVASGSDASDAARGSAMFQDDEPDIMPVSDYQKAITNAQKTRALQTANAAAFLAATSETGKHKLAGKNIKIGGINGYVTDKGLFKQWTNDNLMINAGKYGCPAPSEFDTGATGYTIPDNTGSRPGAYGADYGAYVGAPMRKAGSSDATDTLFLGTRLGAETWNTTDEGSIPACGNEGSNVQGVYPAKATGASYKGSYNADKMEHQKDMTGVNVHYKACKTRAEDKGRSVFGISTNRCYIGPGTLEDAQSAGLAYEFSSTRLSDNALAQLFYFGMDGTLSLLESTDVSSLYTNKNGANSNVVTVYDDADYKGRSLELEVGTYNHSFISSNGFNDTISSIKVPSGLKAVAYQHDIGDGSQWTFTRDTPVIGGANDTISSIIVSKTVIDVYTLTALKSFGLTTGITGCDIKTGAMLSETPKGTYGGNCNSITRSYVDWNAFLGYR